MTTVPGLGFFDGLERPRCDHPDCLPGKWASHLHLIQLITMITERGIVITLRRIACLVAVWPAMTVLAQTASLPTVQLFAPGMISWPANDGSPTFSPDGKRLFFTRYAAHWSVILESHLGDGVWSEPVVAPFSGIRYIYDPSGVPEVDIRFTDGISLSIKLQVDLKAEGGAVSDLRGRRAGSSTLSSRVNMLLPRATSWISRTNRLPSVLAM
jgi:WD40-like Beta Propeller Repeat